jgi:hypothetical protein
VTYETMVAVGFVVVYQVAEWIALAGLNVWY